MMNRRTILRRLALGAGGTALAPLIGGCADLPGLTRPVSRLAPANGARKTLRLDLGNLDLRPSEPSAALDALAQVARNDAANRGFTLELTTSREAANSPEAFTSRYPKEALLAGSLSLPDVALVDSLAPASLYWDRLLLDATELFDRLIRQKGRCPEVIRRAQLFNPKSLSALPPGPDPKARERFYCVPFYGLGQVWLYRADLFAQAKLAPPKSYPDALTAAETLGRAGKGGWAMPVERSLDSERLATEILLGYGASIFDDSGRQVTLESPQSLEALAFLAKARTSLASSVQLASPEAREEALLSGRIAFGPMAGRFLARLIEEERAKPGAVNREALRDGQISPMLALSGTNRRASLVGTRYFVMSKSTGDPALAEGLVEALVARESLKGLVRATGGAYVPLYSDDLSDPFWDGHPLRETLVPSVWGDIGKGVEVFEHGFSGRLTAPAAEIARNYTLSDLIRRVVVEGMTPEAALKEASGKAAFLSENAARALAAARRGLE